MFERNNCCRFPVQDPLARGDCQTWSGQGKIDTSRALAGGDADTPADGPGGRVSPQDSPGADGSLHDIECAAHGFGMARNSSAALDNTNDKPKTELGNQLPDKLDE